MGTQEEKNKERDDMIKKCAQDFRQNGFQVWAKCNGFRQPIPIVGYMPDIIAKQGTNTTIVQIEIYHSLGDEQGIEQKETFKKWAEKSPFRHFIYKVV